MKKLLLMAIVSSLAGPGLFAGITNRLHTSGSSNRAAFNNAYYWVDADGNRGAETAEANMPLNEATDYLVSGGYTFSSLNTNRGTIEFGGRSLTLGTDVNNGNFRLYSYGEADLVFASPGLFMNRGTFWVEASPGKLHRLSGVLTVLNGFTIKPSYSGMTLQLDSKLCGGSDSSLRITCPSGKEPFFVNMPNEDSEYGGKLSVAYEGAEFDKGYLPVTLALGSAPVGAVEVRANAALASCECGGAVTVGDLTLDGDSHLIITNTSLLTGGDVSVSDFSRFVVTNALTLPESGKVHIHVPYFLPGLDGPSGSIPVLSAPSGSIDVDRFAIVGVDATSAFLCDLEVVTGDGTDTLNVVFEANDSVVLKLATDSGASSATIYDSGLTNGVRWSDGAVPHGGVHYVVRRVGGSSIDLRTIYSTGGSYVFPGLSLTIGNGCNLYTFVKNLTVTNLTLLDGANVIQGQWSASLNLSGEKISVPSGKANLRAHDTHTMSLFAPLSGKGQIVICGFKDTSSPHGNVQFMTANPDFAGTIHLTSQWGGSWGGVFSDKVQNQTLSVATPAALGAPLEVFDPKALIIDTYGEFIVPETMAFTDTTRGIWLGRNAQIRVPTGVTASFFAQRTMDGETFVRRDGTLALGGTVRFANGVNIQDVPQPNLNRLTFIEGGSLKALSVGCIDGVTVAFSNETSRLILDADTDDAALAAYGVRNVKTDVPFAFEGETMKVEFSLAGGTPLPGQQAVRLGMMTVSAAAAEDLRGRLDVKVPRSVFPAGSRQSIEEAVDPETGDVTFSLHLRPCGFALSIR